MPAQGGPLTRALLNEEGTKVQKLFKAATVAVISSLALAGCAPTSDPTTVVLVTHDSFVMSEELQSQFETKSGYQLKLVKAGDTGSMTNKLILTKEQPIGDAVFGIDNTLLDLAAENELTTSKLVPIDFADVCFNYDINWFAAKKLPVPESINDLTLPRYKKLTVVSNPATSSSGMAFLATSIAVFGEEGYLNYWTQLKRNGVKIVAGWEDAYFSEFSGSSGRGKYPIVLSYSSSPAAEVRENGKSQTASIRTDCYRQTEFAGVLTGASNPKGALELIEFLKSSDFQASLPENMYVYPIDSNIALPDSWNKFAPSALTLVGEELDVAGNRKQWLKAWSALFE
jgi:thiamine transport system substrate-binding protein